MDTSSIIRVSAALAIACLSGCGSTPRTSTPGTSTSPTITASDGLTEAVAAYRAGHYREAQAQAQKAAANGDASTADAAYVAGLSALRQENLSQADRLLREAATSPNPQLASKAKASLGIVRMQQERYDEAAELLRSATDSLNESDARHARRYASMAQAMETAEAPTPRSNPQARSSPLRPVRSKTTVPDARAGVFALQVGNFLNRENASRAAIQARDIAANHRLGPVRTIPGRDHVGRRRYVVQFGHFASRGAAASARKRMGRLDYIVAPRADAAP